MKSSTSVNKILILAASPTQTSSLNLDEEVRDIEESLQRSQKRDQFIVEHEWAVRPRDIRRAILDFRPNIIHFSGHGSGEDGLVFENDGGNIQLVTGEALAELFRYFSQQIDCIILNACYSEKQAKAIGQHIDYVIGMKAAVNDKAAIEFSVGFYDGLAAYNPIYDGSSLFDFAFNMGCNAINLENISGASIPVINRNPNFKKDSKAANIAVVSDQNAYDAESNQIQEEEEAHQANPVMIKSKNITPSKDAVPNNSYIGFETKSIIVFFSKLLNSKKFIIITLLSLIVGVPSTLAFKAMTSPETKLIAYASDSEGTAFTNQTDKAVEVSYNSTGKWLAIPDNIENVNARFKGYISANGVPDFESNSNKKCTQYPLGALVVKGKDNECKAGGENSVFQLKPRETVYFVMNDVNKLYSDNKGSVIVNLSIK